MSDIIYGNLDSRPDFGCPDKVTAKELFDAFVFSFAPCYDIEFIEHLQRLLDQSCKEQREICASNMLDLSGNVRVDRAEFLVNNAPKPDGI